MRVLLLRPHPGNDRFGLGPFFQVEPLGLEILASVLSRAGHRPRVADLRFPPSLASLVSETRPELVGISCLHALEYDRVIETAREIKRLSPRTPIIVGGHAAAAYPLALQDEAIDSICLGAGETAILEACADAPRLKRTYPGTDSFEHVPCARAQVAGYRPRYRCLQHRPVWLIETARGCPFRCSFCAVWSFHQRRFEEAPIGAVIEDFRATGPRVFVVDDLFFHTPARSLELARALLAAGIRKKWILVQSRTDLVSRHPELLEAWRALTDRLDVFFGFEAATDDDLARVSKDASVSDAVEAIRLARALHVGVTGNFVIDPDWGEDDFARLWSFVDRHELSRAGYTILTPLPGTDLYARMSPRMKRQPWWRFDMHHVLWEPRLGKRRFFELYAETWRRSVLHVRGARASLEWIGRVRIRDAFDLARMLGRVQRMMRPSAYLAEHLEREAS
jgi:radical SAM superfamily enzyme YgiQ (UPF0313 family)